MEIEQSPFQPQQSAEKLRVAPLLHTISETCTLLSISPATVYRMIAAGTLITVQIGGRRMVKAESIRRLAETGTAQ